MRIARSARRLSGPEIALATSVFGGSLPSWNRIFITDAIGPLPTYDNPYTTNDFGLYFINVGAEMYPDVNVVKTLKGYGPYKTIFIHEMTHVWQYKKGYHVAIRSAWANTFGAGYSYKPGQPWDDYNVEQQGDIVADWYERGMKTTDPNYVYIDQTIRKG